MPDAALEKLKRRTSQYVDDELGKLNNPPLHTRTVEVKPTSGPNPYEARFHSEFSFMSLVLGVFGLVLPLFGALAIVFGIAGLMQTHRERMKGKWMAVTGIVLGFLGMLLIVVAILLGIDFLQNYLMKFGGVETLIGSAHQFAG